MFFFSLLFLHSSSLEDNNISQYFNYSSSDSVLIGFIPSHFPSNQTELEIPRLVSQVNFSVYSRSNDLKSVVNLSFEVNSNLFSLSNEIFFRNLPNLQHIFNFPVSISSIPPLSFSFNKYLETLIPSSFPISLGTVFIHSNISSIGASAFSKTKIRFLSFQEGSSLKQISDYSFRECQNLSSVFNFPSSILKIPISLFEGCSNLNFFSFENQTQNSSVLSLPSSLLAIEKKAFSKTLFSSVVFEKNSSLKQIGNYVFGYMEQLFSVVGFPKLHSLPEGLFCGSIFLKNIFFDGYQEIDTVLFIPSFIHSLGNAVFFENSFSKVIFEENSSLHFVGDSIFCYCFNAVEILNLPIKNIPNGTFAHCINLKTIQFAQREKYTDLVLPDFVQAVGDGAFFATRFEKVVFEGSVLRYLGSDAFNGCQNLISVHGLPKTFTKIPHRTFANCSKLQNIFFRDQDEKNGTVFIPNIIQEIGESAFLDVEVKEFIFEPHSSLRKIGGHAFSQCKKLVTVSGIGRGISKIPNSLFYLSSGLQHISFSGPELNFSTLLIPNSVQEIYERAFMFTLVTRVIFEKNSSLVRILDGAFSNCYNLAYVRDFPKSIKILPLALFYQCPNLVSFNVEGVCLKSGIYLGNIAFIHRFAFYSPAQSKFSCIYDFNPNLVKIEDDNQHLTNTLDAGLTCLDDSICVTHSEGDSTIIKNDL